MTEKSFLLNYKTSIIEKINLENNQIRLAFFFFFALD